MAAKIGTSIAVLLGQAAVVLASEAKGAADKGLFSGEFVESVWTVVAFTALVLVLGKFAWRPLLASLKAREDHIQGQIDSAAGTRQQAEQALEDSKQQGAEIIQQAREDAVKRQTQIVEQTRKELNQLKEDAHGDIEHARRAAMEHLWQQSGTMVQAIAHEVLGRTVTDQDNHRLILEAVEQIRQQNREGKA
jgi:F-type H+-transporting ATPase subunit b